MKMIELRPIYIVALEYSALKSKDKPCPCCCANRKIYLGKEMAAMRSAEEILGNVVWPISQLDNDALKEVQDLPFLEIAKGVSIKKCGRKRAIEGLRPGVIVRAGKSFVRLPSKKQ